MAYRIRPQSSLKLSKPPKAKSRPRANFIDTYGEYSHVPHLTVFEEDWQDTMEAAFTGLFDAEGNPIFYEVDRMTFIGFLDPDRE